LKIIIGLLFYFTFSYNIVIAQSGWVRHETGLTGVITSVFFINNLTGWISLTNGKIEKSTNGGINWFIQESGTNQNLNQIIFISINEGYVVGDNGIILKTTNSGNNWVTQNSVTLNNLKGIDFPDENTGFITGDSGIFIKTTNKGINWSILELPMVSNFRKVQFIDDNTGWILSFGILLKTLNSGINWIQEIETKNFMFAINFPDVSTGYICNTALAITISGILKTTNSGSKWFETPNLFSGTLTSLYFINSYTGWVAGSNNQIYKTINGGNNWLNQSIPPLPLIDFISIFFTDSLNGWASAGNLIYKTTTGGVITGFSNTSSEIPEKYFLSQNYPNPFNPVSHLEFGISNLPARNQDGFERSNPGGGFVSLRVYNVLGNEIAVIVNEWKNAGTYNYQFSSVNYQLPSGIYYYTLSVDGNLIDTKRMVLLK